MAGARPIGRGRPRARPRGGHGARSRRSWLFTRACGARWSRRLLERWSPQQIAARLVCDYPDDQTMRISHETIYRTLFVQARGALRKELTACLRTERTQRRAHKRTEHSGTGRIRDMVPISARPHEAEDRAIPGTGRATSVRHRQ